MWSIRSHFQQLHHQHHPHRHISPKNCRHYLAATNMSYYGSDDDDDDDENEEYANVGQCLQQLNRRRSKAETSSYDNDGRRGPTSPKYQTKKTTTKTLQKLLRLQDEEAFLKSLENDDDDNNNDPIDEQPPVLLEHVVLHNVDTFDGICLRYGVTPVELRRANGGFSGTNLRLAPAVLKIPTTTVSVSAARSRSGRRRTTTTTKATAETTFTASSKGSSNPSPHSHEEQQPQAQPQPLLQDTDAPVYKLQVLRNQFPTLDKTQAQAFLESHAWDLTMAQQSLLALCGGGVRSSE